MKKHIEIWQKESIEIFYQRIYVNKITNYIISLL